MLQMGWRTENMTQVRLTKAVWCGWSQLIRLKQRHINLKSIKSAETIGSTEADSQRSEVGNLSGGSRVNTPCLGATIVARQATFWQESQVWYLVVVSASEAESFSLCPVPDARCVAMSDGIPAVWA